MFNMFSGLFGKKQPLEMQNSPDALGQASMGAPEAFGQGMPQQGMDKNRLAMMLMMGQRGFGMGMNGFNQPAPQMRNPYQNMTPPQQSGWFNPQGR